MHLTDSQSSRSVSFLSLAMAAIAVFGPLMGTADVRAEDEKKATEKVTFVDHVQPLLRQRCAACHNPDKKSGGLDLSNYTNLMLGGSSGEVIFPGDAESSYLYMLVTHEESPEMPPESEKLPAPELELIEKWINQGALETKSSKALMSKKPKLDLALADTPSGRPEKPAMPLRMALDPSTYTSRRGAITAMATSPWAPVAAISGHKQILLYSTTDGKLLGALDFPEGEAQILKFSRNGSLLLAGGGRGGASGKVVLWNVETGQRITEVGDELDTVLAADISADQSRIALGGPLRVVRIYSTATGELLHELRKHTDWVYNIEFSPDGVLLATADRNGGMFVWEAFTGREYLTLKGHSAGVTGMSWRSDSNILATGSEDNTIRLWELENGREVKKWTAHGGGVSHIEFARDGRLLSAGRDKVAKLWDQSGKVLRQFEAFQDIALRVTYCDETNHAIAGDFMGAIHMWKADDGAKVADIVPNPAPIAQRLKAAEEGLQAAQAKNAPIVAAFQQATAAANTATTAHQAAIAALNKAKVDVESAAKALAAAQAAHKTLAEQHKQMAAQAEKLGKTTPMVTEAATKAKAAAAANPEDKELAALATQFAQLEQKRVVAAKQAADQAAAKLAELKVAEAKAAAAGKVNTTMAAAMKAAQDNAPKMEATMKAAVAKAGRDEEDRRSCGGRSSSRSASRRSLEDGGGIRSATECVEGEAVGSARTVHVSGRGGGREDRRGGGSD